MDALVGGRPERSQGATADTPGPDCVHCGLPIPAARRARADRFCCDGCGYVYELIHDAGLSRYYDLRNCPTAPPAEARPDSLAWLERQLAVLPDTPTQALTLDVQGIHCAACVWLLRELFTRRSGAVDLRINPSVGRAEFVWQGDPELIVAFIREAEKFGYRFGPPNKPVPSASRELLIRLAISAAAALNVMMFSLSFYFGLAPQDGILFPLFGGLNLALGTLAAGVGGWVFLRGAVRALRHGIVHLDLPIATGIVLAWAGSAAHQFTHGADGGYFDSLAVFVTLMLLGRWLQERHLERNASTLLATDGIAGLSTRVFRDGRVQSVPATDVAMGDELWVVPGDLFPVRATVLARPALASMDWINGESRPRRFLPGEEIPAGAFNATPEVIRSHAAEGFADSQLHRLLGPAPSDRTDPGNAWGRVARGYVLAVFTLAAAGFAAWYGAGLERALSVTVSILVVTCPCAIGLAIPLAHDLAHHSLRRRGVFVRRSGFLERATRIRHIVFDKTGTLTHGSVELTPDAEATVLGLSAADLAGLNDLVIRSNHPVSRAIARVIARTPANPISDPTALVLEEPGQGVRATLDGRSHRLGRRSFALADPTLPTDHATWWTVDGVVRATLPYVETLRHDAREEIRQLTAEGWQVHLLSGDTPRRVASAAEALGIDPKRAHASRTPEEKAEFLTALDRRDTLTIGDGLNDAPAFAASYCAGTPAIDHAALPARADFYYLGDGIRAVRAALHAARRLRQIVRDDLILAVLYNVAALSLCFAGKVTPAVAAILMPLGSLGILSVTFARLSDRSAAWK